MSLVRTLRVTNMLKYNCIIRPLSNSAVKFKDSIKRNVSVEDEDEHKPIKYSRTPANLWMAKHSRMGMKDTRLWFEPYVIMVSVAVFLIYFCILREENDIDVDLNKSIYQRIPGLEEQQLHVLLRYNIDHGLDTKDVLARLKEIEMEKNA